MTQSASVITDAMRATIGRESEPVTYEIDNLGCRQFARAVRYTDPIYYDEAHAKSKGYRGIAAPVGFLGHPIFDPTKPPRIPEAFRLDIPYKRILNGGTDVEYFDDVCSGGVLSASTKLTGLEEREGRMGPMLIVNIETTYRNQQGKTVAIARGTAIRY